MGVSLARRVPRKRKVASEDAHSRGQRARARMRTRPQRAVLLLLWLGSVFLIFKIKLN
jgi:hypothetical protein